MQHLFRQVPTFRDYAARTRIFEKYLERSQEVQQLRIRDRGVSRNKLLYISDQIVIVGVKPL